MIGTLIAAIILACIVAVVWSLLRFIVEYAQASRAFADLVGALLMLLWVLWVLNALGVIAIPPQAAPK